MNIEELLYKLEKHYNDRVIFSYYKDPLGYHIVGDIKFKYGDFYKFDTFILTGDSINHIITRINRMIIDAFIN